MIRQDEDLKRNAKLLASIPGIGDQSVWCLLGHLGNGQRFRNGKAAATFFGLTPMVKQSGSSVYTVVGISKIGHSDVRKTLYMPAVSFSFGRWANGPYAPFVARLLKSGKSKNTIIVALMRKLVTIAQSVLKHQKPFDPALLKPQS
ncbi:transposase [Neisseria sp. HSC-16F19]|nr:transposase [Neisseria sp. HSC-16F19]